MALIFFCTSSSHSCKVLCLINAFLILLSTLILNYMHLYIFGKAWLELNLHSTLQCRYRYHINTLHTRETFNPYWLCNMAYTYDPNGCVTWLLLPLKLPPPPQLKLLLGALLKSMFYTVQYLLADHHMLWLGTMQYSEYTLKMRDASKRSPTRPITYKEKLTMISMTHIQSKLNL
jgi:hypothetical protein